MGQTIPGTRSYHFFKSVNSNAYKRIAEDDALAGSLNITGEARFGRMTTESLRLNDRMEQDLKINFLHASGPARSFHRPRKPYVCWAAFG